MLPRLLALAVVVAAVALAVWLARQRRLRRLAETAAAPPQSPRDRHLLLFEHVGFYARLPRAEQARFRERVGLFLGAVRVEGAGFAPDDLDRLLVAASAQMLVFRNREWRLPSVREVILQPTHFDDDWAASDPDADMLGMVGEEIFSRTVILSRTHLHEAFAPGAEVHVGLHEFAHVLDRADGATDGCPSAYLPPRRVARWRAVIAAERARVEAGTSWLDPYAAEDPGELFAVATEHYFLYPHELRQHHRELWGLLRELYG